MLVVFGLMFFVLPQFSDVFAQFDMPLPVITQALLGRFDGAAEPLWLWGSLAAAAGREPGLAAGRSESGDRLRDHVHAQRGVRSAT